jgi:hypothetical protein
MDKIIVKLFFFFLMSLSGQLFAQVSNEEMEKRMREEFDSLAAGGYKVNNYTFNSNNERYFLDFLNRINHDVPTKVRFRILVLKTKIAFQSKDSLLRQEVVFDLTETISDHEELLSQFAINKSVDFQERDFTDRARNNLTKLFARFKDNPNFLLICGIAQTRNLISGLQLLALNLNRSRSDWFRSSEWYAQIVLARIKKPATIDTLISITELELSPVLRVTKLLQLVAYTRHPDAIKLLTKYLESSEVLPSVVEAIPGTKFNQYAMEFLALNVDNFPIKAKGLNYTKDEISLALAYLKKISRG